MKKVKMHMNDSYCIVSSYIEDADEFALHVQEMLNGGWLLSGGLTASNNMIFQALSK